MVMNVNFSFEHIIDRVIEPFFLGGTLIGV